MKKPIHNIKVSLVYNVLIVCFVLLAVLLMMLNIHLINIDGVLDNPGYSAFKFFTVDSNILVAITSLIMIVYEILFLNKRINKIPNSVYILKFIGTSAVMVTFIVTLLWLSPLYGSKFYLLYINSNFVLHLVAPLLAFISYIKYEKNELGLRAVLLSILPMVLYGIYYVSMILTHLDNGAVSKLYDFYGLAIGGPKGIFIVFSIMLLGNYLLSLLINKLNHKK